MSSLILGGLLTETSAFHRTRYLTMLMSIIAEMLRTLGWVEAQNQAHLKFCSHHLTREEIQEIGEDLGELLGRILDAKISIENIIKILEI